MKLDETGVLREDDGRLPPCPKCEKRWEMVFEIGPFGPHWAKCTCRACGHVWWPPKPDRDKSKRPSRQAKLVKRYSRGFCELCLIPAERIPACESLTAHHVDEYHLGGDESRENIWIVCTRCEKLIHHQRTYIGHLVNGAKDVNTAGTQRTAEHESVGKLDSVEDCQPERGQADEGTDPVHGLASQFYGPEHLGEF